jgi:magnesium-transporting ATPase (P-type)
MSSSEKDLDRLAHNSLLLKIFFLVVSAGLLCSTITGLYMSYKYSRNKVLLAILFIAGIVVPISLTLV